MFPKVFERYQGMLAADDLVVLSGKLSIREEDTPKLLVDRVVPLEEWNDAAPAPQIAAGSRPRPAPKPVHHEASAPQLTDAQAAAQSRRKLYLRIRRDQMDQATAMLPLHPGSVPVYLHLPEEKLTLLVPRLSWCDATEDCLRRLSAACGADNVRLVEK